MFGLQAYQYNSNWDCRHISTISWSVVDRIYIGTISWSIVDCMRIGMIGQLIDRMHISTIIVCVGSSTVLATGSFGWQYNTSNGVIFVGVLARILVCLQAYWYSSCLVCRSQAFGDACDYIILVHTFYYWQFFLCACGTIRRQLSYL